MGTGFAIGKPGEPVEYIVTNGHVVEYGYMGPKVYAKYLRRRQVYFSAAENDYVTGRWSIILRPMKRILRLSSLPSKRINEKPLPSGLR